MESVGGNTSAAHARGEVQLSRMDGAYDGDVDALAVSKRMRVQQVHL